MCGHSICAIAFPTHALSPAIAFPHVHAHVIFRHARAKQVFLACSACDPIGVVKAKLEVKEGIPAEEQRLLHRGWLLDKDHRTLAEYGLTPDLRKPPILHLLLRSIAAAGPRGV